MNQQELNLASAVVWESFSSFPYEQAEVGAFSAVDSRGNETSAPECNGRETRAWERKGAQSKGKVQL